MTNLMPNSGFEKEMQALSDEMLDLAGGWHNTNAAPQVSEVFRHAGLRSLVVGGASSGLRPALVIPRLEQGVRYGISYRSYNPDVPAGYVAFSTQDIEGGASTDLSGGEWHLSVASGLAQNNYAIFSASKSSGGTFAYLDNVMLVKDFTFAQMIVLPYRDGDFLNWIWNADGTSTGPRP